jgi:Fe-S-cluster containining protein
MKKAFECKICGYCCYGEGGILLQPEDVKAISRFLKIKNEDFVSQYCEKRNGRLYIRTGETDFCIFYDKEKKCLVHPVKPKPCSLWPFFEANVRDKDNWELAKDACPGINPDCSFEDFVKQSKK